MSRWYVNDKEVYMSDEQPPAVTLSVNSLTDPSKVNGSRTTTLKILATDEARQALGNPSMRIVDSGTRPVLRCSDGGVDYFRSEIIATRRDRDEFECQSIGGNASWFEYAKGLKLREFDFGLSPEATKTYQRGTWTDESDILYFPLIDHNSFKSRTSSYDVPIIGLRPAVRIYRALEDAFAPTGYKVVANGSLADEWKKLILQGPTDKTQSYGRDALIWQCDPTPEDDDGDPTQGITTAAETTTPAFIHYDGPDTGPITGFFFSFDQNFLAANQSYSPNIDTRIQVELDNIMITTWQPEMEGSVLRFVLWEHTQGVPLGIIESPPLVTANQPIIVNGTFDECAALSGQQISVGIWNDNGNTGLEAIIELGTQNESFVHFHTLSVPYVEDLPVFINSAMPDKTLADLVIGLVKARFLVIDTDLSNKTINFWFDKEYFRKPVNDLIPYRDWSDRMDHSNGPARIFPDQPVRIHYLWNEDSSDVSLKAVNSLYRYPGYGCDVVEIGGIGDEAEVKPIFAATAMGFLFDHVRVPLMRTTGEDFQDDDYGNEPRLLIADGLADGNWKHAGDAQTQYPKCYFSYPGDDTIPVGYANNVYFGDERDVGTVSEYGDRLLRRMSKSPVLEAYLFLRDHELQSFDFGMPTLIDAGDGPDWYYVQEIQQHRFGAGIPTKCLLVKIESGDVSVPEIANAIAAYPTADAPCITLDGAPTATDGTLITSDGFTANWDADPPAGTHYVEVSLSPTFGGAAQLVGWTFPSTSPDLVADAGIPINQSRVISTTSGGTTTYPTGASGSPDKAIQRNDWSGGSGVKYWQVDFTSIGFFGLTLSSAQRSSSTGPRDFKVQYRIGLEGTWTDVPDGAVTLADNFTSGALDALPLPSACDDQPQVFLRWIMTSNTRVNGTSPITPGGLSMIDNISVDATSSPEFVEGYEAISGNGASIAITGLNAGTDYYYRIRSASRDGCPITDASGIIHVTTLGAEVYYSQGSGNVTDAIWSNTPDGDPTMALWSSGSKMVVQDGHTVTVNTGIDVGDLQVDTGGTLVLDAALTVNGTTANFDGSLSAADASELKMASSAASQITGTGTLSFFNLTTNTAAGTSTDATINIRGTLQVNAGDFNATAGDVTLISTATGTANLGKLVAGTSYTGNLTVQRYIPLGSSDWRMLGSAVSGQTVANWAAQFDTCGFAGSAAPSTDIAGDGLSAGASIRSFKEDVSAASLDTGMTGVIGTTVLAEGKGFYVWIGSPLTTPSSLTISLTGPPNIGIGFAAISLPTSFTDTGNTYDGTNFGSCDGMNLLCNPLPCPIDFGHLERGSDVLNEYWIFDPVTHTLLNWSNNVGEGALNGIIQSGQAFWVVATGPDCAVTVDESAKVTNPTGGAVFG